MADWLSNVQQKTKTAVSNGGGVAVGGKTQVQAQPRVQGKAAPAQNDWLNSVTSKGKVAYKPNQLISDIKAPIQPVMAPPPPKDNLLQKAGKLTGISTGEVKGAITKGIEFVKSQDNKKAITQEEVIQKGKDFFGKVKDIIVSTVEKETGRTKDKEAVYKKERNIPEAQALTFDQTRDFSSVGMLKLSKEDFEKKLEKMKAKPNKSNIDNYRIKNTEDTLKLIDETLAMPPQERVKRESLITGLALGRVSGNLATGFLGSLEGVANFIKWRGDVAESKGVSDFGETAAQRVNEWARETAPNNPELADELIQGVGSTAAFYLPGAGISSASSRLAMVSPKLATFFGIAASATLEAGTESGTTYQEALNMGKTREEADLAASRVFAGNVMFNLVTDKVGLFSDAEGLKKVFTSAISEGGQEAFQEALQNVNQDKAAGENVGKSFIMGLIVGGGMGAAIDSAVANPTITPEDRIKLLELGDEIAKAQGDPVAAERLAEEFIAKREALVKKMTMPEVDGQTSFTDTSGGTAFESDQTGSQIGSQTDTSGVQTTVQQQTIANDRTQGTLVSNSKSEISNSNLSGGVEIPTIKSKTSVELNQDLRNVYTQKENEKAVGQAWYEVMAEMDIAEAGQRLFNESGEFSGSISSTFPDWVPEELRRKDLFTSVLEGFKDPTNITYPPNSQPRKQALYDEILSQLDSRAGTSSIDIIDQIKESYDRESKEKTKPKKSFDSGVAGSEGTARPIEPPTRQERENAKKEIVKRDKSPKQQGFVDLRGKKISSEVELASLLKNFRNPSKEIFHLVYVNNNKIVSHRVITSKGHDYINVGEKESFFSIDDRLKRSGADGFYTVHNHPSGITEPSYEDIQFAKSINNKFGIKVKGNIVLDHNNISSFNESGLLEKLEVDLGIAYGSKGDPITSANSLEKFVEKFYQIKDNKIGVLVLDARGKPIVVKELNSSDLTNISFAIKQSVKENNGSKAILLASKENSGKLLIGRNIEAVDLAYYDENKKFVSLRSEFGAGFFSKSEGRMQKGDQPVTKTTPAPKNPIAKVEEGVQEPQISTPENRAEGVKEPVTTPKGTEKRSTSYRKEQERQIKVEGRLREEFKDNVIYKSLNIAEESGKAMAFADKFPDMAERIAKGYELPPAGYTQSAISLAVSEKAKQEGNNKLFERVENAHSLRLTRLGQEIVMNRGRVNENAAHHFINQVRQARLEAVAKVNSLAFEVDKLRGKTQSKAQKAVEIIDKKAATLRRTIDKETLSKLGSAQELLDKLTCKI